MVKDTKPRCHCGKYCGYMADNGTHYGCENPEWPEPLDPIFFCKTCSKENYKKLLKELKENPNKCTEKVWWIKPDWYQKALKKFHD